MEVDIKNESQQLIDNFSKVTGDDKTKAMVVMSTGLGKGDNGLLLACSGVGSMLLNIQASAMVETFSHLIRNGTIKHPQIAAIELISSLNKNLLEAASVGATTHHSDTKH